ncbi:MAG: hypothetical protein ACKVOI_17765 [Dongiaceae bacterium]
MQRSDEIAREVFDALARMGGHAPFWHITYEIRQSRRARGAGIPETFDLTVRRSLEERCGRSCLYRGDSDLFVLSEDGGQSIWSINHAEALRQRRIQSPSRCL